MERIFFKTMSKPKNVIIATLSENELIKVMHCKSDKQVWDKLENISKDDKKVNKSKLQTYRMRFESLKMR